MIRNFVDAYQKLGSAVEHFEHVAHLFGSSCFKSPTPKGASLRNTFVSSLIAGQTALEAGLSQIMAEFGEESSNSMVADDRQIIQQASCGTPRRAAILEWETADFADLIRRFRDNLTRGVDALVPPSAAHLAMAAQVVADQLLCDYLRFLKLPAVGSQTEESQGLSFNPKIYKLEAAFC